ncbi:transglutaminaseTgpA domain-containing protein [Microcoleus sp. MON2_D5]|uniref:transglutaminaseTgpA domain-containing protein n=1 Tax=Microcoleus sp. MON2_D5 TaxID=2818833 RepID=UPI002FD4117D
MTTDNLRNIPVLGKLWEQIEAMPPPVIEDSLLLRILVQLLVIVGIVATDVAAEEAQNLWAVPVSIVGATWSWYRRRDRNVAAKFCIAIGMLVALFAFFSRLVGELNDTRLVLAQLLIQLQVLHSFDLPRRKDLGYSMVIGLILLGVAATLSQTLTFGPLLLLFLALALPTLVLDYRSRLGFVKPEAIGEKAQGKGKNESLSLFAATLSPKYFGWLLLITVGLGLTIFAFLPRLPGYQLRTFPVSAPIQYQGEFDSRSILNPGYVRGGNEKGTGGGRGRNPDKGPGEVDSTFYYGFNQRINQNLRGEMKPQVVMRVRSQAAGFWRVLGFDKYTGQGWEISRNEQAQKVNRPRWSYQFYLNPFPNAPRTQEVIQTYNIVAPLPNLIPALNKPKELYFPSPEVAIDAEGGLRAPGELGDGVTYTVISNVPFRDRSLLGKTGTNYPKNIRNFYLDVPPEIAQKVREKTEEILAARTRVSQSDRPIDSPYEKALYLAQYLKQNPNYKIEKALPYLEEGEDLVQAFLFGYKNTQDGKKVTGGYPDHFSTVLTIMLRSVGIPARLVGGFDTGEFNPFTGYYVVKNTDAFLMTEVYFPNNGWFAFNPIPGYPLIPASVEDNQTFSALQSFWQWIAGWLPTPLRSGLDSVIGFVIGWITLIVGWFLGQFAKGWVGLFTGLIAAIAFGFIGWLIWQVWRKWRHRRWLAKLPPVEGVYQEMLKDLASRGFAKQKAQTPLEYAEAMRGNHATDEAEVIDEVSQAYVRWKYGGEAGNLNQLRQLVENLRRSHLKKLKKRWF